MSKETVVAEIDTREPEQGSQIAEILLDHDDVEDIELRELASADIAIEGIGFERKTMADYASSITEGRLTSQVQRMREDYDAAYILLDGTLADSLTHTRLPPESVRGSMASVTARDGVSVIPCSSLPLLADMAVRIARKHIEDDTRGYLDTGSVEVDAPIAQRMYGCIPGVGPEMAEALYTVYPTVNRLVTEGTVERLTDIDGIGEKRAETIMEAL